MMEQGFRGNCDSQGKLGMCSSLAEPYASGFSKTSRRQPKVFWSNNFSKMLARFRASSPDRCPQAAKSLCHAFGTRSGWWEKRQLFEAGRTRPLRLVKPEQKTSILQLFQWNSCNGNTLQKILLLGKMVFNVRQKGVPPLLLPAAHNWKPNWKIYLPMARSIPTNIKTISVPTTSINSPIKTKNLLQKEKPLGGSQRSF